MSTQDTSNVGKVMYQLSKVSGIPMAKREFVSQLSSLTGLTTEQTRKALASKALTKLLRLDGSFIRVKGRAVKR